MPRTVVGVAPLMGSRALSPLQVERGEQLGPVPQEWPCTGSEESEQALFIFSRPAWVIHSGVSCDTCCML